jgi:hypothetical protein
MSWTSQQRNDAINAISAITSYVNEELLHEIDAADQQLLSYIDSNNSSFITAFETKKNNINEKLNILKQIRKKFTNILSNAEMQSQRQKLREIGELQQTNKSKLETINKLNDELKIAEAREDAIKNRNVESSYSQTFGYIFRPFRRVSYAIIVPLIFIIICMSIYLISTISANIKLNKKMTSILPIASAPPVNNFNKQMKELFK